MSDKIIKREDYEEPCCPFTVPGTKETIPVGRVIEKLDEYLSGKDTNGAERHLKYWYDSAVRFGDKRGELSVANEFIGFYRKNGDKEKSLYYSEKALELAEELNLGDSVTMGTTLINVATAYRAAEDAKKAVSLYEKARAIYEKYLKQDDKRLAGLYNNEAMSYVSLGEYAKAGELLGKALSIVEKSAEYLPEQAVTYCNFANLTEAEKGLIDGDAEINDYLEKAMACMETEGQPIDGNYAYVCEKCAETFSYYGFFAYEKILSERAEKFYERP